MDILVKKINKSYNDKVVFKDFSCTFYKDKVNIVMGKSGQGKTTLLKILCKLENIDSGEIKNLENKKVSVVFQEDALCENLTVLANIKLVNKGVDNDLVNKVLKKIDLEGVSNKRVNKLSGGMKRRVAIIRALLYDFDVLVLDEPFKGLDLETKEKSISLIKEYIENKIVIIITHDVNDLNYFEKICVISV